MTFPPLLALAGYQFEQRRHAVAILSVDYSDASTDLADALAPLEITWQQVIEGGGGKSSITQALERRLKERGWNKKVFSMKQTIDESVVDSTTHEIDHFRGLDDGRPGIALEIEWNNKDPFFDRDLAAFARLHLLGVISLGVIVTRGPSLRLTLKQIFRDHYMSLSSDELDVVVARLKPQDREKVKRVAALDGQARMVADIKSSSKYGEATTHWNKLMARLDRGLGNPCPLLLIGIEADRLHR
jgi:Restriction endonuclease BglII